MKWRNGTNRGVKGGVGMGWILPSKRGERRGNKPKGDRAGFCFRLVLHGDHGHQAGFQVSSSNPTHLAVHFRLLVTSSKGHVKFSWPYVLTLLVHLRLIYGSQSAPHLPLQMLSVINVHAQNKILWPQSLIFQGFYKHSYIGAWPMRNGPPIPDVEWQNYLTIG